MARVGYRRICEPLRVGRPGEVLGAPVLALVDHCDLAGLDVAHDHFVAVVADGDQRALGRDAHRDRTADVPRQRAGGAVIPDLHALVARFVAHCHYGRTVGEPLRMTMARAVWKAELAHRALPQAHREELAAHVEREAVAVRMHFEAAQVIAGGDELARRLRAMRGDADRHLARLTGRGIEEVDVGTQLVHDALAIGLRMASVEIVVVGVAHESGTVGLHRVEVAYAFAVGEEVHALADPHRARDVAGQLGHAAERAAARGVDPKMSRGTAAIALPARGVGGVASDHHRLAWSEGQVVHLSERQHLRHAARGVQRVRAVIAEERLAVRRDEQNVPVGREAANHHIGPEPRHAPGGPAFRGHEVHLGMLLVATHERDPLAVRRQARRGGLSQASGETARVTAFDPDAPQVVVAHEDDSVPV